jgi:hypothetical protein
MNDPVRSTPPVDPDTPVVSEDDPLADPDAHEPGQEPEYSLVYESTEGDGEDAGVPGDLLELHVALEAKTAGLI